MLEKDHELMERYLAQEMSATEVSEFEQRLQTEAELKNELEAYTLALYAIRQEKRGQLKTHFRQLEKEDVHVRKITIIPLWVKVAISVAALLLLFFFTRTMLASYPETLTPAERDQIFAGYFEVHRDETINPNTRGPGEDTSAMLRWQRAYWDRDYQLALQRLDTLKENEVQNDRVLFFKSNLLMATQQYEDALVTLRELNQLDSFVYATEVKWYMAMVLIRTGKIPEGVALLKELRKSGAPEFRQKALDVLKRIKETQ